ncbi:hypothetical protein MAR_033125, partial [Mya arenaria]
MKNALDGTMRSTSDDESIRGPTTPPLKKFSPERGNRRRTIFRSHWASTSIPEEMKFETVLQAFTRRSSISIFVFYSMTVISIRNIVTRDDFRKTMNAEQFEDFYPPDECAEIRRRVAADRFVVITGYGKSFYLRTALYVVKELDEYKQEFCAMISDPTDWKHIEPKELKLVLFNCPFGETEPNKRKTRAMLDILNNVQLTTKDSECPLVVIVVTQWEIMQTALKSVGSHHGLLDEPVKLYKENNEQEPEIIDDGSVNDSEHTGEESDDKYDASDGEPNSGPVKVLDNADAESNDEHGVSDSGSNDVIVVSDTESIEYAVSDEESDDESFDLTW